MSGIFGGKKGEPAGKSINSPTNAEQSAWSAKIKRKPFEAPVTK